MITQKEARHKALRAANNVLSLRVAFKAFKLRAYDSAPENSHQQKQALGYMKLMAEKVDQYRQECNFYTSLALEHGGSNETDR
jgi:hypothetical protein